MKSVLHNKITSIFSQIAQNNNRIKTTDLLKKIELTKKKNSTFKTT